MKKGFTLIEILVSMIILLTVVGLILSIFVIAIRSTTKITNLHIVRENGNFAISQMTKMLQFGQEFNGVSMNGSTFSTVCQTPGGASTTLQQYQYVKFTAFDGGETVFSCTNSTIASNSASLIDNTTLETSSCSFTCSQITTNSPQTIGIQFVLEKKNATSFLEDPAPVSFQTSLTIRNVPL